MINILSLISEDVHTVAIAGHVRPDGDCMGSTLAVYNYLTENRSDIEVTLFLEKAGPELLVLKNSEKIVNEPTPAQYDTRYDLFIALDCADSDRMGFAEKIFKRAKHTVCFDHHISNQGYADENYIFPDASSTCEVMFESFEENLISKDVAECLYTGIIHDTGVFHHSCTKRRTMEIAGILMEKGIPFDKIIDKSFYAKTYLQNQVLGRCLAESILLADGKVVASYLTHKNMELYGVTSNDLGGVVDQLRLTDGIDVAIFTYETAIPNQFKVSLRSTGKVDVNKVAGSFGGGGHIMAAGCVLSGNPLDVIEKLVLRIEEQL